MTPLDQPLTFHPLSAAELATAGPTGINWLWDGFLAPGIITLLTGQWKGGKTTLVTALLAQLERPGRLAGQAHRAGRAVILTEEAELHWDLRHRKLAFGNHLRWYCKPFRGRRPTPPQWQALLDHVLGLHAENPVDLIVIDSLIQFYPAGSENSATAMIDFLSTLRCLTDAGIAVWLLHHPAKGRLLPGQAARGSGSLSSFVDIIMEMSWYRRSATADRCRRLANDSRFDQTPRRLVIELNAEGTTYTSLGDIEDDGFADSWNRVRAILRDLPGKSTRMEILKNWPDDYDRPCQSTLWRWIDRARDQGLIHECGGGTKQSPFRYWLPERENDEMFNHITQLERFWQAYKDALRDRGYFPPFDRVLPDDQAYAERVAAERAYGTDHPPLDQLFGRSRPAPQAPPLPATSAAPALASSNADPPAALTESAPSESARRAPTLSPPVSDVPTPVPIPSPPGDDTSASASPTEACCTPESPLRVEPPGGCSPAPSAVAICTLEPPVLTEPASDSPPTSLAVSAEAASRPPPALFDLPLHAQWLRSFVTPLPGPKTIGVNLFRRPIGPKSPASQST
jgi:hypothetical protein